MKSSGPSRILSEYYLVSGNGETERTRGWSIMVMMNTCLEEGEGKNYWHGQTQSGNVIILTTSGLSDDTQCPERET